MGDKDLGLWFPHQMNKEMVKEKDRNF